MVPFLDAANGINQDMADTDKPDPGTLARAIAGDTEALSGLLEAFGPILLAEIDRGLSPKHRSMVDAEDVFQVSCVEAFLRIRAFVPGGDGSFLAWMRKIARNNLLDALKELDREKRPPAAARLGGAPDNESYENLLERLAVTSSTPSRICTRVELHEGVENALRQLPPDYESVIRFYELSGLSGAETAERMGRSPGAIRMLLARARGRLAEILAATPQFQSGA